MHILSHQVVNNYRPTNLKTHIELLSAAAHGMIGTRLKAEPCVYYSLGSREVVMR